MATEAEQKEHAEEVKSVKRSGYSYYNLILSSLHYLFRDALLIVFLSSSTLSWNKNRNRYRDNTKLQNLSFYTTEPLNFNTYFSASYLFVF